jgi:predicted RNA binding protein YcfA (HicA-like mRNA interferase family)
MQSIRYRDLARHLTHLGCTHIRTRGSHEVWRAPDGCITSIPYDRWIAPGTLRNIRNHLTPCLGEGWLGDLEK